MGKPTNQLRQKRTLFVRGNYVAYSVVASTVECKYSQSLVASILFVYQPLDILAVGCESSALHRLLCYGASFSRRHIHHSSTTSHLTASAVTDKHGCASVFIEDEFSLSLFIDSSNCSLRIQAVFMSFLLTHF